MAAAQAVNVATAQGNPTGLLHRMVKANMTYAFIGREATMNADGAETEQWVRWDPKMGLRRESIRPAAGDLLIDNFKTSYRYTHERDKQWSQQNSMLPRPSGRINEVLKSIKQGDLRAEWVGQEQVAGRNADIVRVTPSMSGPAPTRKFWIDRATGIRLKSEDIGPGGRTLSTSYYLSLEVDPQIDPHLFDAPALPAGTPIKQRSPAQKVRDGRSRAHRRRRCAYPGLSSSGIHPSSRRIREQSTRHARLAALRERYHARFAHRNTGADLRT